MDDGVYVMALTRAEWAAPTFGVVLIPIAALKVLAAFSTILTFYPAGVNMSVSEGYERRATDTRRERTMEKFDVCTSAMCQRIRDQLIGKGHLVRFETRR